MATAEADTGRLDGASTARVFAVLAVIILYTEVAPLNAIMLGTALQKMTVTFASVGANLTWSTIISGLVGVALSPVFGKMSDALGKKRIFILTGAIFVVGCLIDALTTNWTVFLVGRGLQGLSAASTIISYGLIRDILPRKYVPVGLGATAAGLGFSGVLGPIIAGLLVDHFGWQAMFWFLAIYLIVLTPVLMVVVPESKLRVRERFNPTGIIMLSAGVLLILLYLDKGQVWGWGRPTAWGWLAVGLLLLAGFFVVESTVRHPIMDMRLLRAPKVSMTLLLAFFGTATFSIAFYAYGYMTQSPSASTLTKTIAASTISTARQQYHVTLPAASVHVALSPGYSYGSGFSLTAYALHLGIWSGLIGMLFGPLAGLMARRWGPRLPVLISLAGAIVLGVGNALSVHHYSWQLFLVLTIPVGITYAFAYAALPNLIVEGVPAEQQGISVGMLGVALNMSGGIGLAVVTALLNANPVKAQVSVLGRSATEIIPDLFADKGYIEGFWVITGMTVVALVIALVMRHGRTPATGGAVPAEEATLTEAIPGATA